MVKTPANANQSQSQQASAKDARNALCDSFANQGYICTPEVANAVYLATQLTKPLLIEGPPGVGKTELAVCAAKVYDLPLIRLQCHDGLDELKSLYEWRYSKQLLYTQILKDRLNEITTESDNIKQALEKIHQYNDLFYSEDFLEPRPLLQSLQSKDGAVLLIDEVDKAGSEFEALLLELLTDYQVTIPELGLIKASKPPLCFLSSNDSRELGEPLRRRCLHLFIDFPDVATEERVVAMHVPQLAVELRHQLVAFIHNLRQLELRKPPSIGETIDWARTLVVLHNEFLDADLIADSLGVLLKHRSDQAIVAADIDNLLTTQP